MPISRSQAIELLAQMRLLQLLPESRIAQVETMANGEDWSDSAGWSTLDPDVRAEFKRGQLTLAASDKRYDAVLLVWLRHQFTGATNVYLEQNLRTAGLSHDVVIGPQEMLEACPCCGQASLGERAGHEICRVCWWEDDGQDNEQADVVKGGPNYHLSLTQARANFLEYGISDPAREDLRAHQEPREKYAARRIFVFASTRDQLFEQGTAWTSRAFVLTSESTGGLT